MTTAPGGNPGPSSSASLPPYRRPLLALVIVGVTYAVSVTLAWPGLRAPVIGMPNWAATLVESAIILGPLLLGALVAVRWAGPRPSAALGLRFRPVDVLLGALVALVLRAVIEIAVPTTGSLRPVFADDRADETLTIAAAVLSSVVLAPVIEELFFRGAMQRALQGALGATVSARVAAAVAIAITTLAFALLHAVPYGASVPLAVVLPPLAVGLGAGALTATTGRIAAGMVAHVLFNLVGVLLLLR